MSPKSFSGLSLTGDRLMLDLAYLGLGLALFIVVAAYARGLTRL
jgi:hypothetical protein